MASLNLFADTIIGELGFPFDKDLKERIKQVIKEYRALFIRHDLEKNGGLNNTTFIERINVEVEPLVDIDECNSVSNDCIILKSISKLPKPVREKTRSPFKYVGSTNGKIIFDHRNSVADFAYASVGRFGNINKFYSLANNYLYLYGNVNLEYVTVEGIFEYSDELIKCVIDSNNCFKDDDEYPLSLDMAARIRETVIKNAKLIITTNSQNTIEYATIQNS